LKLCVRSLSGELNALNFLPICGDRESLGGASSFKLLSSGLFGAKKRKGHNSARLRSELNLQLTSHAYLDLFKRIKASEFLGINLTRFIHFYTIVSNLGALANTQVPKTVGL